MQHAIILQDAYLKECRDLAMAITEKTYNGQPGTGYQYFRDIEGSSYNGNTVVAFLAVEFDVVESGFLGGPFEYNDSHYGLVSIYYNGQAKTQAEFVEHFDSTTFLKDSTIYMPYQAAKRVNDHFGGKTKFWFDQETKQSYSDIDLLHGKDEIDPAVFARLSSSDECAVFFQTKAGLSLIESMLTAAEVKEWEQKLQDARERCKQEALKTTCLKEKPWKVRLQGTDDCSWEATFATEREAVNFVYALMHNGQIEVSRMTFTN